MKSSNGNQRDPRKSCRNPGDREAYASMNLRRLYRSFIVLACVLFIGSGLILEESGEASPPRSNSHRFHRSPKKKARKHRRNRPVHQFATANDSPLDSEPKQEGEFEDDINQRQNWFYFQRAYPFGSIPEKTREQAWANRPIRQAERQGPSSGTPYWGSIGPTPTTASRVAEIGTTSGRINSIAVSPANDQLVLIGAATGGIWRSTDGGAHFVPVSDSQVDLAVGSLAFAPSNSSTVCAGMGDGPGNGYLGTGVLKSTDAGVSWTRINDSTLPAEGTSMRSRLIRLTRIGFIWHNSTKLTRLVTGDTRVASGFRQRAG